MARKMTLDFIQIYYDDIQKDRLYPFATPYKNNTLTDYFESSVIADLVPNLQADLISICSWRLAQKRGDTIVNLKGDTSLTEEKILSHDFDIAVLTPRSPRHQALSMASMWHGQAWDDAFDVFKNEFLPTVGITINGELKKAIYENHFIARKSIYQLYVESCLAPAIRLCQERTEIFGADSGYVRKKRDQKEVQAYQEKSGRKDWPIAPFILERLFSIWINDKNFKVINL